MDTAGDGILAVFRSVIGATQCAVEIQTVMAARNKDAPGGVLVSQAVHDQVRDRLDLAFEDLGERELKNIARNLSFSYKGSNVEHNFDSLKRDNQSAWC